MKTRSDQTEVAKLRKLLATSEARRQLLLDASLDSIICTDGQCRVTEFSSAAERTFRISRADALGHDLVDLIFPEEARDWHRRQLFTGVYSPNVELVADRIETNAIRHDGSSFACEMTVTRSSPEQPAFVVHVRDITAHKRAEEALVWLAAIVESSRDAIIGKDLDGRIMSWNKGADAMYGYTSDEVIGKNISLLSPPDLANETRAIMAKIRKGQHVDGFETARVAKDGASLNVWLTVSPVQASDGTIIGAAAIARDLTAEKLAQEALRTARDTSVYSSPVPIVAVNLQGAVTVWNPAAAAVFGWTEKEVLGKPLLFVPEEEAEEAAVLHRLLFSGETLTGVELRRRARSGSILTISLSATPLWDENRQVKGFIGFLTDVTDLKKTQEAWRRAEEKYRSIFENAIEGIYQATPDGKYLSVNPALASTLGFENPEELMKACNETGQAEHGSPDMLTVLIRAIEEHGDIRNFEYEAHRNDGQSAWLSASAHGTWDASGRLTHLEGTVQDITERRELEAQLRQMQKMEVVGRVAGGVAHDFNNILMAISSYSELLEKIVKDPAARRYIDEIVRAVDRGSSVTQALLAFSRKQMSSPRVMDLNAVLAQQLDMLKRLIPENVDLKFLPASAIGNIKADPTQIEQVVMNLVINARDAMPNGGTVVLETGVMDSRTETLPRAVATRRYTWLAISDNGCGMDTEVKSHLFEPFFTTKDVGKGTGLGLATVFGIVKQSMGNIVVHSEPGVGTTFKIFFPCVEEVEESSEQPELSDVVGNGEVILLVEDDAAVREPAAEYLTSCGYTVLKAPSGRVALEILEKHEQTIHLLLTDLVMPGMSGRELSEKIAVRHAEMKTIFMSGYSNNLISSQQLLDPRHVLLQKPFRLRVLGECVQRTLNRTKAASA